jgi:hypothetical protein
MNPFIDFNYSAGFYQTYVLFKIAFKNLLLLPPQVTEAGCLVEDVNLDSQLRV